MTPQKPRKSLALTIQKNTTGTVVLIIISIWYDIPYVYISWQSRKSEVWKHRILSESPGKEKLHNGKNTTHNQQFVLAEKMLAGTVICINVHI